MTDTTEKTQVQELPNGDKGVESKVHPKVLIAIAGLLFESGPKPEEIFASTFTQMKLAALAAAVLGKTVKVELEFTGDNQTGDNQMSGGVNEEAMVELANMDRVDILKGIVPALDQKFEIMEKRTKLSPLAKMLFDSLVSDAKEVAEGPIQDAA